MVSDDVDWVPEAQNCSAKFGSGLIGLSSYRGNDVFQFFRFLRNSYAHRSQLGIPSEEWFRFIERTSIFNSVLCQTCKFLFLELSVDSPLRKVLFSIKKHFIFLPSDEDQKYGLQLLLYFEERRVLVLFKGTSLDELEQNHFESEFFYHDHLIQNHCDHFFQDALI
jgi:hypothetical protein